MADAIPPTLPTKVRYLLDGSNGAFPPPADNLGGTTVQVGAGVAALNAAIANAINPNGTHKGDTLEIPAATLTLTNGQGIVFPVTTGLGWTCLRVVNANANFPAGQRVSGSGPNLAKLVTNGEINTARALTFPTGSNGWRLIGIEATHPDATDQYGLIDVFSQRVLFERCRAYGHAAQTGFVRCFYIENAADVQIWDSWLEAKHRDLDAQGVFFRHTLRGYVGNCEVRGTGENILIDDQASTAPSEDITIERNYLLKPLTWQADGTWFVKNLFEIKYVKRCLVQGNLMENCWVDGQDGTAVLVNCGTNTVPDDVMIRSNKVVNAPAFFSIDYTGAGTPPARIALLNNLGLAITKRAAYISKQVTDLWMEHNTILPVNGNQQSLDIEPAGVDRMVRLTLKLNIWGGSQYGVVMPPDGAGSPTLSTWNAYLADRVIAENVELAGANGVPASGTGLYPGGPASIRVFANAAAAKINLTTGVLDSDSPLKAGGVNGGSDSKDIGVDFVALAAAIAGDPPLPSSTFSPLQTPDTLTVVFTNTSDGAPFTAHEWDFGDGSALVTPENTSHTYAAAGQYFVTHRVTNAEGQGTSGPVAINVTPPAGPPTIVITGPTSAATYPTQSPTVVLSGTATDVTSVTWANTTTGASGVASGLNSYTTLPITLQAGANVLVVTGHGVSPNAQDTITVTYTVPTPATPLPPDLMRGFGPVRGVAANDFIQTPLTAHAAQRTILFWYRRDGSGARCLFTKSSNAIQSLTESIIAVGDGLLHLYRQYSGGTGEWTCPEPVAGARHCLVVKIDTGAPTALPILKIDNAIQTLTAVRQPAGGETPVSNAAGYMLGNWPGQTGSVLGDLAKWTVYNRLTTDQEDTDFYEGDNPMTIGVAPVAYHVLDGTDADEPSAVSPFTDSVVTGTQPQNYAVVAPPTVTLSVTSGNPATGTPYQMTAATTGPVNRVEIDVDSVLTETRTVAPYLLFDGATGLLGPGPHTIVARVYETAGATVADTATLPVTEPSVSSGEWLVDAEWDRLATATSYKLDVDGGATLVTVQQPASGNPRTTFPFTGADREIEVGIIPVLPGPVDGPRVAIKPRRYTDPSATAIEGLKETSRAYDGTNWLVSFRWDRKPTPVVSYNFYRDGSVIANILQPASGNPTCVDTFTGAAVEKVMGVAAVYAGPTEGPRASTKFSYVAPATQLLTGFQEHSRTYTP